MTQRVLGPSGSKRRRRFLIVPLLLVAVGALLLVGSAQAVHDEAFQLDGDVSASTTTTYGGHTQSVDWDSIFTSSGANKSPLPTNFTAAGFKQDFLAPGGSFDTQDNTTYTQGSKDIDNVSAWVCTGANNVTHNGDIMNSYATAFTDPVSGDQKLYFALERSSNAGDANVGFWFLQDATADCDATNGTVNFTGNHQDGDIFIVSAFTKGGDVSTVTTYRWTGGASGTLNPVPGGVGGDCRASTTSLGDPVCAVSNESTISTPWLTNNNGKQSGLDNSLDHGELFEGGINLTDTNLAGKCFNVFLSDTRASQSTTSAIYDFARGRLGECTSTTTTTPTPAAGSSTEIPANAQVTASDSAEIKVAGVPQFSGSVDFYLCGPDVGANANCQSAAPPAPGVKISTKTFTNVTSPHTETSG